ncbi:MAG: cytochrome C [Nitrosomonadales bacterium]|nr:cytochrome C [Nitrosomonadales bacterium]
MKWAVGLLLGLVMGLAHAIPDSAKWKEECGSCHVPYPPHLLSADNWQSLMGGLNKHFGANAVLESNENSRILGFLQRHAGSGKQYNSDSLRITDTPWFRREHRSISAQEWINPNVKNRSNCSACHGKTVLGD